MIIFSDITIRGNNTQFVSRGCVSGSPICYADLRGWRIFEDFIANNPETTRLLVEVETFGYGEGEHHKATPEEVAYMLLRSRDNERFTETRCSKIRQHKIDIDLEQFALERTV